MKPLEYLYFNIYTHYSRRSYFTSDLFIRLQTMYMLCLSAGGWVLLLQAIYLRLVRHVWFTTQSGAMLFATSVYLIIGLLFYRIFIVNEHDQKILDKYARTRNSNTNKKRDLFLSVFIAIVPYIFLASLKMLFMRS